MNHHTKFWIDMTIVACLNWPKELTVTDVQTYLIEEKLRLQKGLKEKSERVKENMRRVAMIKMGRELKRLECMEREKFYTISKARDGWDIGW